MARDLLPPTTVWMPLLAVQALGLGTFVVAHLSSAPWAVRWRSFEIVVRERPISGAGRSGKLRTVG